MANATVAITQGSGTLVDVSQLTVGSNTVDRQRFVLSDDAGAANLAGIVAKGAQAAYALGTQDLKDSGRNVTAYFNTTLVATSATETLLSLTGYKGGAAVAATTTPAVVTTGKTYRVTSLVLGYMVSSGNVGVARFSLRAQSGGVVTTSSPLVASWWLGAAQTTTGVAATQAIDFDDGIEFAAGTGIGITLTGFNSSAAAAATGYATATLYGFEY